MILNGRPINPGELRTHITLLRRTMATETGGFQRPTTATIADVWARWINVHGQEAWTAATVQAEQAATVLLRYRADVDTTCLVRKGTQLYEIVSVDNIQERGEFLELKVKRQVEG